MKPSNHAPDQLPVPPARHSLRQTIAIAICGGIGGASVLEAFASAWLHPAASVAQPTASPLALAGALLGSTAALIAVRRFRGRRQPDAPRAGRVSSMPLRDALLFADSAPLSPMSWEPGPRYIPYLDEGDPSAALGPSLPIDTLDGCPAPRTPRHTATHQPHQPQRPRLVRRVPARS